MSLIYWDTMLFVYLLEDHPQYSPRVGEILAAIEARGDTLCTSALTAGELLVGAKKRPAPDLVRKIHDFFYESGISVLPFTLETAERFADVRATHGVSPADAMHLACAAQAGVNLFLTHDRRLRGLVVPGIHFIAGLDTDVI